ncbi:hypothetical protein BOX15_Mlig014487g3 [Macrostomum lignano]|uniref:Uncharacterized protein n=3 Tax=Macrostomum lignano TaxID=282301 RepID=A0A267G6Q9_9PLAT|nr:hypothetical protein BOX15_Mlig014487g3 [Macrostomum lignano]
MLTQRPKHFEQMNLHRLHSLVQILWLLPLLQCLHVGSSQSQNAKTGKKSTDLTNSGCHRAVDKNDTLRFLVLDAGSTGTRAALHEFFVERTPKSPNEPLKLRHLRLRRYRRKPGLSAFQHFPDRSRDQVNALLAAAAADVPEPQRAVTCVALRATAGLRLLDSGSRRRILRVVRDTLATSAAFLAPDIDSAKLLSGPEEAKFAWLSVNYMLGKLDEANTISETVPVLELGGGSAQVAYEYPDGELSAPLDRASSSKATLTGRRIRARSYLGLGVRESVLRFVGYRNGKSAGTGVSKKAYNSSCIAANASLNFSFGSVTLQLEGNQRDNSSGSTAATVKKCFAQAEDLVQQVKVRTEPGIAKGEKTVYAISSIYYLVKYLKKSSPVPGARVTYSDSVCPSESRGVCKAYSISAGDIADNAAAVCRNPPDQGPYTPYYCINLSVLSAMLEQMGLPDSGTVTALGGSDNLGWTLGFSLDALLQSAAASAAKSIS